MFNDEVDRLLEKNLKIQSENSSLTAKLLINEQIMNEHTKALKE